MIGHINVKKTQADMYLSRTKKLLGIQRFLSYASFISWWNYLVHIGVYHTNISDETSIRKQTKSKCIAILNRTKHWTENIYLHRGLIVLYSMSVVWKWGVTIYVLQMRSISTVKHVDYYKLTNKLFKVTCLKICWHPYFLPHSV